jgi:hypothetical protein
VSLRGVFCRSLFFRLAISRGYQRDCFVAKSAPRNDSQGYPYFAKIKELKEGYATPELNPGDQLRHKVSGQDMWVINDDGKTVFLNPDSPTIKYPLDKILNDYIIVKLSKNK